MRDKLIDDTFALHGHQRSRLSERHAHLQARSLPGFVVFAFRHEIHAILSAHFEPPVITARNPHLAIRITEMSRIVVCLCAQDDIAGNGCRDIAVEQTLRITASTAAASDRFDLAFIFVGVEAANQALAMRIRDSLQ